MLITAAFAIISVSLFAREKAGKKDTHKHTILYTRGMHDSIPTKRTGICLVCVMKLECSKECK